VLSAPGFGSFVVVSETAGAAAGDDITRISIQRYTYVGI